MRRYLMVSITSQGQAHWLKEWVALNRGGISVVNNTSRTVTTVMGDTYSWVVLGPNIQGTEVDAVFLDDRMSSRPTGEQWDWLEVLPICVRPSGRAGCEKAPG